MPSWKRFIAFTGIKCEACGTKLRPAIAPLLGIGALLLFTFFVGGLMVPGLMFFGPATPFLLLVLVAGTLPLEVVRD